jgi:hypothetical protein
MLVIWLVPAVLLLVAALWIITRARLAPPTADVRSVDGELTGASGRSADRDVA